MCVSVCMSVRVCLLCVLVRRCVCVCVCLGVCMCVSVCVFCVCHKIPVPDQVCLPCVNQALFSSLRLLFSVPFVVPERQKSLLLSAHRLRHLLSLDLASHSLNHGTASHFCGSECAIRLLELLGKCHTVIGIGVLQRKNV